MFSITVHYYILSIYMSIGPPVERSPAREGNEPEQFRRVLREILVLANGAPAEAQRLVEAVTVEPQFENALLADVNLLMEYVGLLLASESDELAIYGGVLTVSIANIDRPEAERLWAILLARSPSLAAEAAGDIESRLLRLPSDEYEVPLPGAGAVDFFDEIASRSL
jgi:hypothetical protein